MHTFLQMTHKKLKCEIRKYSLATEKKRGGGGRGEKETEQNEEHKDTVPSVFADTSLKPSAAKWNVTAGGSGSARDPLSTLTRWWTHMHYLCLNARISPGWTQDRPFSFFSFSFFFVEEVERERERKKAISQIKYHTESWSLLSGSLCPGEIKPVCPLFFFFESCQPCCCCTQDAHRAGLLRTVRSCPVLSCPVLSGQEGSEPLKVWNRCCQRASN